MTATPSSANSGGSNTNAQRSVGLASGFRMAVIGDAVKTPSSPPVDESRGCGAAMVLDNAQWLDHNRCVFYTAFRPFGLRGDTSQRSLILSISPPANLSRRVPVSLSSEEGHMRTYFTV